MSHVPTMLNVLTMQTVCEALAGDLDSEIDLEMKDLGSVDDQVNASRNVNL